MRIEIRTPPAGDAVEIEVAQIYVHSGAQVSQDEPVLEVATDKASIEIAAPQSGTIVDVLVSVGDIIEFDEVLMIIETDQ